MGVVVAMVICDQVLGQVFKSGQLLFVCVHFFYKALGKRDQKG